MPDCIVTATADATGKAVATMPPVASGLEWIVQQIGLGINPLAGVVLSGVIPVTVARDGKPIASSNQGNGGSCGGQPFYKFLSSNILTITWLNAGAGSQCVGTISYTEHAAGQSTINNTGIV